MSCLRYLYLLVNSGVQHILCCVLILFLGFVYNVLPVSLDCPFLIALSVFSNVYSHVHISAFFLITSTVLI